jgi:hypothetical protein
MDEKNATRLGLRLIHTKGGGWRRQMNFFTTLAALQDFFVRCATHHPCAYVFELNPLDFIEF